MTTEFVTDYTFAGGLANYIHRTCIALKAVGIQTVVFVDSLTNETFELNGIKVVRIKPRKYWWYWALNIVTLFRLNPVLLSLQRSYGLKKAVEKYHRNSALDIVQYATTRSVGIFMPRHIPSVMRISSYQKLLDQMNGDKQTFRLWQKQYLQDIMLKRARYIFGPSKMIGHLIAQKFNKEIPLLESPFTLDNNEADTTRLDEILSKTGGNPYLLYFGSLSQLKGLLDIAEILYDFFDAYPDYYFVFIGKDIPVNGKPVLSILKEKAGKYSDRIIWYFSTPHSLLYPIVKKAEAVVLPSRLDNFPNTCIEAMAFGKIVIGTYKTSFEQLIDNNVSGILCEHSNPKSLKAALDYAMHLNENQRAEIGRNAIHRIEKLKPEIVVKDLIAYYKKVIELSPPN